MFLAMAGVMLSFVGGTFYGAKSEIAQGLVNEVSVLVGDAEVDNKIRAERKENIQKVKEQLDEIKLNDCAKRYTMRELKGLQSDELEDY